MEYATSPGNSFSTLSGNGFLTSPGSVCSPSPGCSSVTSPGSSTGCVDMSSIQRQQRNLAEKQRRDKFNGYIHELASIVPMIAKTTKRLDKTSILRLTAAHMRLHLSSLKSQNGKKARSFPEILLRNLALIQEAFGGFLMVVACTGKIIFTSSNVETYIGHQDIDMLGHSLFAFIHSADLSLIKNELDNLLTYCEKNSTTESKTSFYAHMREHSQPRSESFSYRTMQFHCTLNMATLKKSVGIPRVSFRKSQKSFNNLECSPLIKMFVKPVNFNPLNELSLTEAFQDEYVTTHGLKGEILYADHRISTITGHLPNEVRGLSAYQYICSHDIPVALFAQKRMFSSESGTGIIVYRLRTRSDNFVYLQSRGFLEYKESSTEISHFICYNKLLSDEEGSEELKKFQEKFLPHRNEIYADSELQLQCLSNSDEVTPPPIYITEEPIPSAQQEIMPQQSPKPCTYCPNPEIQSNDGYRNGFVHQDPKHDELSECMLLNYPSHFPEADLPQPQSIDCNRSFTVNRAAKVYAPFNPYMARKRAVQDNASSRQVERKRKHDVAACDNPLPNRPSEVQANYKKSCQLSRNSQAAIRQNFVRQPEPGLEQAQPQGMLSDALGCLGITEEGPQDALLTQGVTNTQFSEPQSFDFAIATTQQSNGTNCPSQNGAVATELYGLLSNLDFNALAEVVYSEGDNYISHPNGFLDIC